jgi:tRNA pseudouridine32 synthase/23S rRNA pseudouridine746 synthase
MTKATNPPDGGDITARVLHRDGLMLIVNKPAGIPVHRGPRNAQDKSGAAFEDQFGELQYGLPRPPVLAHRLDRDTSGCLVLGRHRKATATLGLLFKHNKISKTYWAVVEGGPTDEPGTIDITIGRMNAERGWWQKPDPDGLPSTTKWTVLGRSNEGPALTWLALEPITGRTHQLRVHCAAMGWPIVGDSIYGTASRTGDVTLHLHARAITVPLSKNKPAIAVEAPVPEHMHARLTACGWSG